MRIHLFLIAIIIVMAFILGRWSYLFKDQDFYNNQEKEVSVEETIFKMVASVKANGIIDIFKIYDNFEKRKLLNPELYSSSSLSQNNKINCQQKQKEKYKNFLDIYRKDELWQQFECSLIDELPDMFFEYPPYIHPSGKSYVYLYYKMKKVKLNRDWIERNLNLFHILELNEIKNEKKVSKSKLLDIFGSFNLARLQYLVNADVLILLDDYLLVKKFDSLVDGRYYIYDLNEVQKFLDSSQFIMIEKRQDQNQKKCLYEMGNSCWRYSVGYLFQMVGSFSIYLFVTSIVLLILVVMVLIKNILKERKSEDQRRHSLQILTHEFRTPVAAMLLGIEKIQQNFNHIGLPLQDIALRLSNDVYRLQRLVEKSSSYLNLSSKNVFKFQLKKIDSINVFLSEIIDHYFLNKIEEGQLKIVLLKEDSFFYFDQHWIGICLKNLIENSFAHGLSPVTFSLFFSKNNELLIEVADEGSCSFKTIEQMCGDFVKSSKSKGMGLGLKIVKKIVEDLDGQLSFLPTPTRFQIKLSRHKLEKKFNEIQRF
ncbi:MAG: HAMP domain-containing histidine kinase [Oligoflexia bacterium]|nr:HAMP domain-containing histidine kinase [Oligoflexia bacterium]